MAASINLFVAQLDKNVDDAILRQEFGKFGDVLRASVVKDEIGDSKGYGFVHFRSMADGLRAMDEMNGKPLYSRTICIYVSKSQEDGKFMPRSGKTTWASEWNVQPDPDFGKSDSLFEISESTVDEQRYTEVTDVKQRLCKLYEDQLYTDVLFYPKDNQTASISAHKALLAVGSPLFAKMLFGDQSSDTSGAKMRVQISNMSFEAFSNIVKFLYTDDIFFESEELVQEILEGAKQFEIQSLIDRCWSHIEKQPLTEQNVCSKLQMSMSNKTEALKNRCMEYIQNNTLKAIKSTDFLKCSAGTIRSICKLQSLNLRSEVELLEAVMSWLNLQPPVNKRQQMEPLLKCIRFLTFTVSDFSGIIRKYPDLFTSNDGLQIMMYLTNPPRIPELTSLPSWCNKNATSRCFYAVNSRSPNIGNIRLDDRLTGKVIFPLKESFSVQNVSELTSLLEMKCIMGCHDIHAIKLSFQGPVNDRSVIKSLSITVTVSPSGFRTRENIEIVNTLDARVAFTKVIKVRQGDTINFEVEAKNVQAYTFMLYDDTRAVPPNLHFVCCVASKPKVGRLFFISEVEYGPQINQAPRNYRFQKRCR